MKTKMLLVLLCLALTFTLYSNTVSVVNNSDDPFVVVLDAGHGGHDPGNLGNGYLEKKIALSIVLKVGEILSQHKDIKVIYTRKDDTFIDLYVRGEIANKANADLFVSVHCDSHSSNAHGAGTFVLGLHANKQNFEIAKKENSVIYLEDNYENRYADYDINSPESVIGLTIMQEEFLDQSIALAKMIQDNFSNKLKRVDRKVKQAGFIVLHQTFMPSVLVETGFLTNKDEGLYLNSKNGQVDMGTSIAEAILKYKKGVKPSGVNNNVGKINIPKVSPTEEKAVANNGENPNKKIVDPIKVQSTLDTDKIKSTFKEPKTVENDKEKMVAKEVNVVKTIPSKIEFKIQLLATVKNIPLLPKHFRGLLNMSKEPYKNLYRYMHGKTNTYDQAKVLQGEVSKAGYPTCYIVAYENGKRISLKEAVKRLKE